MSTFALVASLVSITELQSLIDAGGCTAGNSSPEQTWNGEKRMIRWRGGTGLGVKDSAAVEKGG